MKKTDRDKLSNAMSQILQLNELKGAQEKQIDALKEVVTTICKANLDAFDKDGLLVVEGIGNVKIMANPPSLKVIPTGKALNPIEQAGLVVLLGEKYGKVSVDVVRVRDDIAKGNKKLSRALKKAKVELIQVDRYDVKKL